MPQADDAPPDGGYGWVIVAIVFLVHFLPLGGILYTFGVFQRYYVSTNTFPGATNLQISFIGSIGSAAMPGLGPLTGRFADKYGYRLATLIGSIVLLLAMVLASFATQLWQAYLTQGLLFGVSMSLAYFPNISCVPQWFSRRRGLAVGLAVSGAGLGGLAMSPAVQAMLASLGHAWTLRILGILGSSATFLSAVFLRTRVPPKPRGPVVAWQYFKIPSFSVLFGASFLGAFGYFTGFYFVSPFATSNGMTASQGALAVALMNGASAVGRVFQGLVADAYLGPFNSFVACQVLAPLSTLVIWPFATSFGVLILYSVVYGFFAGGFVSLFPVVLTIIFGTEEVATVLGTQALSGVVGNLAGPPLAGLILDSTGRWA
ncbi:major facilitator superfamily domain-containing protein [Hyaloraphidium curvatum]|nr:major facilitator superfamily domain-containing protein [Hyaloraphidium curvatum]